MDNEINCQIIEDGYNSSYIISLITSLFYKSSNVDNILNVDPIDPKFIYALEFIKIRFVEPLRRGFSVHSDVINEFRNYIIKSNWKDNVKILLNNHDVVEFFEYLMNKIYGEHKIIFSRISNENNVGNVSVPLIDIHIPIGLSKVNLTELFKIWLNSNVIMDKYTYKLEEIPQLIPLHIKRDPEHVTKVDIMHKIKLFNVNDNLQDKLSWCIHSIICYTKEKGYFSVIKDGHKWISVSDKEIPSFRKLDMYDETDVYNISETAVLVFYRQTQS